MPDGWAFERAEIVKSDPYAVIVVSYAKSDSGYLLKFEQRTYSDAEAMKATIQQDALGTIVLIEGVEVYMKTNTKDPSCSWIENLTYSSVYGPVNADDLVKITESILKET